MKTHSSNWNKHLALVLGLCLCAGLNARGQQRPGGGGFGGFGGFGGGNRGNTSSGSTANQYSPNGSAGMATFSVDPDTGNLIVIGDKATLDNVSQVVASLDVAKPQVLIKVVFLEVDRNNSLDLGVEGSYTGQNKNYSAITGWMTNFGMVKTIITNNGSTTTTTAPGVTGINPIYSTLGVNNNFGLASQPTPSGMYQIMGSDFQATLRAIATSGKAQLLSRPSIIARDRQPAQIVVGQSVPLVTSVSYVGLANSPVNNVTYTDVGIILKVTPFITADGMVQMIVSPQSSSIDPTQTVQVSSGVNAPVIDISSADTVVLTPDRQTVVIGGLIRSDHSSSESKVPLLGDIPLLGALFRHRTSSDAKTELLIFLTPHILRAPAQMAAMTEKERAFLAPKSYSEEELDRFLQQVPVKKQK
jgi:general secretion pathway protein D